ncbi:FAD-linked oxidase C-terminal domain-containing protein [Methylocystis bryophila]|uniref:FAD-binding oxidoreductase n=1 Tax=Methylocystis bryophila TaxID=655015 RepID=A0A1W6MRG0_9HYPH|nr:FAD-linked oxidase C-terminal domain-containing protein [Methylocystis bryophila]ARN80079.1 FAD-binding oxidoreductase [Methylocystis bryophila]BDV39998.1 lactate dehydrogenase [Methylocystis bryophila]
MPLLMPAPEPQILSRRDEIVSKLRVLLGSERVIADETARRAYDCDAFTMYRALPLVVVLPQSVKEVSAILALAQEMNVKVVPRGGGTSLSGGSMPLEDGILLAMGKFNRILEIDYENRCARVQPGVANLAISKAVEAQGFYYAPDPSSQIACSIGGNVAENAGGVHCLKYGLTTNNILGLEIVLMGGEVVRLGGKGLDCEPYDLLGLMTGSEGLLGVVTEVTVRLLRKPPLARALLLGFASIEAAARSVGAIIGKGVIPAGLEMMDRATIGATERFQPCGYPQDAEAMLIVELDGTAAEVDHLVGVVEDIARGEGATTVKASTSEAERLQFWAGRKNAFPAVACIGPDYLCMDGTIPRGRLPEAMLGMEALAKKYGLRVANVFHAGDGNLHPLILYDASIDGDMERAEALGADILRLCVSLDGVLTGEHGVGVEKRDLMGEMFSETDLEQQMRVKCAFDPQGRLNPGKVFPTLHRCAEMGMMHVEGGALPFPELPRF